MVSPEKAEFRSALAELISVWTLVEGTEVLAPAPIDAAMVQTIDDLLTRARKAFDSAVRKPVKESYCDGCEKMVDADQCGSSDEDRWFCEPCSEQHWRDAERASK